MRAHVIENGVVVNTIEVDSLDFMPNLVEATEGSIGWLYINNSFIDNTPKLSVIADQEYQQLRLLEYPPITDYIDGVVKGDQQQIQEYINKCLAVKDKYPKPEA
jgi:hypothetical protein